MIGVNYKITRFFFDRMAVAKAIGNAKKKALSKAGAFIRTRARSSLRRRKKIASPGMPPSVHSKDPVATLKNILFGWDPQNESVVIGPVKLNQVDRMNGQQGSGTVPQLHEFGGNRGVFEKRNRDGSWSRLDRRRGIRKGTATRYRVAVYPPRQFMGPALKKEVAEGKIASAWLGAVKSS